jgi:small subunit ribosomal protein S14
MQKIIQKNVKQRNLFCEFEKKRLILKIICKNNFFNYKIKTLVKQKVFSINSNSSMTRIKNRCILTGRGKKVFRFFRLTRHKLKEKSSQGCLPGLFKFSR